jgi:hypothetical protein
MRQASGAGAASEEAVDDMEVDEADQMDIGMDAGIEDERDWLDVSILDAGIEERGGWEKRVVKGYLNSGRRRCSTSLTVQEYYSDK